MLVSSAHLSCSHLFVAQPQSSSTSAMVSLSDMIPTKRKQDFFCHCNVSRAELHCPVYGDRFDPSHPFYPFIEHSDHCDVKPFMTWHWMAAKLIFKQHLPPTRHHMRGILQECGRVVVLLRDAWSATQSYCQRIRSELLGLGTFQGKMRNVEKLELWRDLKNASSERSLARHYLAHHAFGKGWRAMQRLFPELLLIITYEEMQAEGRAPVLARALRWWGISPNHSFVDARIFFVNRSGGECAKMMSMQVAPIVDEANREAAASQARSAAEDQKGTIPLHAATPSQHALLDACVDELPLTHACALRGGRIRKVALESQTPMDHLSGNVRSGRYNETRVHACARAVRGDL